MLRVVTLFAPWLFLIGSSHFLFAQSVNHPPRLELDLSALEYQAIFARPENKQVLRKYLASHFTDDDDLDPVMDAGKKMLAWVALVNRERDADHQISFSAPQTQPATPIEQANKSNAKIVLNLFAQFRASSPAWMNSVLFENQEAAKIPPVSDQEFVNWGLKMNTLYEKASRWILQQPFLLEYALNKMDDVRGYYFLNKVPQIDEKLRDFDQLSPADQAQYSAWLINLCNVAGTEEATCSTSLAQAQQGRAGVDDFYQKYLAAGKAKWDAFFNLGAKRTDVDWTAADPQHLNLPFQTPEDPAIQSFLSKNIEDEWRWENWQLKLLFKDKSAASVLVKFEAGATPHVNDIAGNIITLDSNTPLTEYNVKWAIRHEFGHVMGFPDCYVEFYDQKEKVMVNYQLDITNLMCSRRGKFKQTHFDQLKQNYFH